MPDYNKGDFTQHGVAGHVNANLRLNEKRLVNIDMTSNEEAEGCTITGTVTDLLNNEVYNIGSGASGNIEITENGENINVAPYATATVNVPSSGVDFVIPEQTINSSATEGVVIQTNFPEVLPDRIVLQVITTAYGQPFHVFEVLPKMPLADLAGEEYTVTINGRIGGVVMTLQIHISKLNADENWKISFIVNDTQTAFTDVLISAIGEWSIIPV